MSDEKGKPKPEPELEHTINPVMDEVDELRLTLARLEEKISSLNQNIENLAGSIGASDQVHEGVMDDFSIGWETYMRHEREFLREHRGKYVAIYRKDILAIGEDEEDLAELIYEKYGSVEAFICKIEEDDEPIQMPPPREIMA